MKKTISYALAIILSLSLTVTALAAAGSKITGMAHDLSFGYGGSTDLGEIAPQDEHVIYIDLTDAMFTWDNERPPAAATSLTPSQIRNAKLSVRVGNTRVLESVTINNSKSRIEIKFLDELVSLKDQEFDFDVILSINGRRQTDYAINFTGTLANPVYEVYADTEYANISYGDILEAKDFIRSITLDLGGGVQVNTRLLKGARCYGTAEHFPISGNDEFMGKHSSIETGIELKTLGLHVPSSTVSLGSEFRDYYVYSATGELLGLGRDKLPLSDRYYLSRSELDIPEDAADDESPEDLKPDVLQPEIGEITDIEIPSYPSNVNDNPFTGR